MTLSLDEASTEMRRLSQLIDAGIEMSREQAHVLAEAENVYRKAKSEAWVKCPSDPNGTKSGERDWTAARKEAWVDAEVADLCKARDLSQAMRDSAREAVRARQAQLSAWQTLVRAHQAEAELARTGPQWTP